MNRTRRGFRAGVGARAGIALLPLMVTGGCSATQAAPEVIAQQFLQRFADGDIEGACDLVAEDGRPLNDQGIPKCRAFLNLALAIDKQFAGREISVSSSIVEGDGASVPDASITAGGEELRDTNPAPIVLERINGRWFITDFG